MASYDKQTAKIERFDKRIEELASQGSYEEKAKKQGFLIGIKTHTTLSLLVETGISAGFQKRGGALTWYFWVWHLGEFERRKGKQNRDIKSGNRHLRLLLIEAARGYAREPRP